MEGLRSSVAAQTAFSLRLAGAVAADARASNSAGNICFSPISIHTVLSLVAAGAAGPTRQQLADVLGGGGADLAALGSKVVELVLADGSPAGGPKVAVANGIWIHSGVKIKPAFEETATKSYKAEVGSVDFASKAAEITGEINSWVEKATSGLVTELLPPGSLNNMTRLVLGNALYFKGAWAEKFDASSTKEDKFHLLDGSSVQVPFMTSKSKQLLSAYDGFQVLRLPYKPGDDKRLFSMYIVLPEAIDGLWNLAEKISSEPDFMDRHIPARQVEMNKFKLPKFKISHGFEASEQLKKIGLGLPFSADADLSEMVDSPTAGELFVSSVFHKAFVEINEEGTEVAAATAAVVTLRSIPVMHDFVADHPFLFLIREDVSGAVLFIGHVLNPLV